MGCFQLHFLLYLGIKNTFLSFILVAFSFASGFYMPKSILIYFFNVILQTPKASLEIKELKVDISKDGTSKQNLIVKLQILPIVVHSNEPRASFDLASSICTGEALSVGQSSSALGDRSSTLFFCEEFSLTCEFGHDRYYPLSKSVYYIEL